MPDTQVMGAALRAARTNRGLSQQAIARAAGLTQAHVSLIERGLDAHLSIFERAAAAVGAPLSLHADQLESIDKLAPYDDEIANRLYYLGRLSAKRLTADRLEGLRTWIEQARVRLGDYLYFRRWLKIIDEGPDAVAAMMTDATEVGRYMRSVATFRPFVSQSERDAFFRRALPKNAVSP